MSYKFSNKQNVNLSFSLKYAADGESELKGVCFVRRSGAVSYTHLDVYKRQVCVCVFECHRETERERESLSFVNCYYLFYFIFLQLWFKFVDL